MLKKCPKCLGGKMQKDWYGNYVCINCGCPEDNFHPDPPIPDTKINKNVHHPGTWYPKGKELKTE